MNLNSNHLTDGIIVLGLLVAVIVFTWLARSKRNEQ